MDVAFTESSGGARAAAAVNLELVALDRKAGTGERLADQRCQVAAADDQRVPAGDANHLMVPRQLPDERVVAVRPVHPRQPTLLPQPEQESVDRGPATGRQGMVDLGDDVLGAERRLAAGHPAQHRQPRLRYAVPLPAQLAEHALGPLRTR